jgi:hypothetical protein
LCKNYRSAVTYEKNNSKCFEILGFDILIDEEFKPWLLEVNFTPSFTVDSILDFNIKKELIKNTLLLVNCLGFQSELFCMRNKPCSQSARERKNVETKERKWIQSNFELISKSMQQIYPVRNVKKYDACMEYSKKIWSNINAVVEVNKISPVKLRKHRENSEKAEESFSRSYSPLITRVISESPARHRLLQNALKFDNIL